jgi:nucleotide-binding universal stress UspA family protein
VIRVIVVPLDGSDFGEQALPTAAALTRKAGATLHLVRVRGESDHRAELAYLGDVERRVKANGPVAVKTAVLDGEVTAALVDYAAAVAADLLVMSTHGREGWSRLFAGSVADDLTAAVTAPVLLVRPGERRTRVSVQALRSILVPLDGTPEAERIIEPALAVGLPFDVEFTLLKVIEPAHLSTFLPETAQPETVTVVLTALDHTHEDEAKRYLDAVAGRMRARGSRVRTRVVLEEHPAVGILAEAEAGRADLIAIQTHFRRGLTRFFLGSVAEAVLHGDGTPVVLHHATA